MGEYFADYDEYSGCWGVFHTEGDGFCYALFASEEEAVDYAACSNYNAELA